MDPAFWDTSALVPLCVDQQATAAVWALSARYSVVVWWATPVEMRSAFIRLVRTGQLTPKGHVEAQVVLDELRRDWLEVEPSEQLRERAESIIERFPLKAADAFQLAAAWTWCLGRPRSRPFLSGDAQLLDAARQLGFHGIEA